MNCGSYWLTIPQAALELKIAPQASVGSFEEAKLPAVQVESVGVQVVSRESVDHAKKQLAVSGEMPRWSI